MSNKHIDEPTGVETVGHEWDGIEELNNPLPRWWLITFYLTIVFAIGYVVVYPAIPFLNKGSEGIWGWTSRGQLAKEMDAAQAGRAATLAALEQTPIEQLPGNPDLLRKAIAGGKAAFRVNCVQCHGAGAAGGIGYPNLNDDDWLWGGNLKEIEASITNGIRQPGNDLTHASLMPNFGKDGILTPAQVSETADYVLSLSGKAPLNANGKLAFEANCVVCHGADGKGMRSVGAPNLTDAIWLYGGSKEQVAGSINKAHAGVMPAWGGKLDGVTIKMLATYVHSLGGGEDFSEAPTQPAAGTPGNAKP
ncbi:cytochrome-c oxidase, cbb3-type subunit III [Novosphingobium sp. B 225]|uniref:cytochrome-c oxidase, cbb3-type subunit III n=1 Tax=Novosphingobium sp. B 225 TaxID=1961849 RepID=UPI000B4B549A|nr:cytochrome-c oxidase, cbb3-type subunit III [Novosphingobium sp. B 225]